MHIAQLADVAYVRFMRLGTERISQENNEIDLIVLYLSAYLLLSTQVTCEIFVYIQISDFLYESAGRTRSIEIVLAEYTPVSYAEILHKLLLSIVCHQCYIHEIPSLVRILHCRRTFKTSPMPIYRLTKLVSP